MLLALSGVALSLFGARGIENPTAIDGILVVGEFEWEMAADLFGVIPAVGSGGVGTCLIVILWSALFPDLCRADPLDRAPRPGADVGVPSAMAP